MNIIELAKKAGFEPNGSYTVLPMQDYANHGVSYQLERFAALVREQTLKDDKDLLTAYLVGFKAGQEEREWVDLDGMEHQSIYDDHHALGGCWTDGFEYERAVIAAFKEKNR
jgi:hypothetical protein